MYKMNYGYSNAFLNHNIIRHTLMVFIIFWKNIKLQYPLKKSAGVPKLGKSRTLTGVSLEIQYLMR
jgi:hypothetical protein